MFRDPNQKYDSASTALIAVFAALVGCLIFGLVLFGLLWLLQSQGATAPTLLAQPAMSNFSTTIIGYILGGGITLGIICYLSPIFFPKARANHFPHSTYERCEFTTVTVVQRPSPCLSRTNARIVSPLANLKPHSSELSTSPSQSIPKV